ncbi:unnamed protein product [Adineta steineri]|uniref:Uncharacterized protein n=1 Tax=Adineta steineri TaxID=433720 RepID=A0A819GCG9_9BILA|nr:unnamed protein product [Adineta steineri]CAF3882010.1 unnamed protein product [Adineta steineri]
MDENQVYSECVTGNIEAHKWWHRRWVKIVGISLGFLIILSITLALVLKFVVLAPKQAETLIATSVTETVSSLPSTTSTTSMTATVSALPSSSTRTTSVTSTISLATRSSTSQPIIIISTTAIPQSTTQRLSHTTTTTTTTTATQLTTEPTITSTITEEIMTTAESRPLTTETTTSTTTTVQQPVNTNSKWKQNGITVAGGNGAGRQLNQLSSPEGIHIDDDDQRIYIADWGNHRIVEWKYGANNGEIVAGSIANGNQINQFNLPTGVTLDKNNHSLIVCDYNNRRVVRWFYRTNISPQIIIPNIDCFDVKLDKNGDLYVSDVANCDVKRWTEKDPHGTIVAGGRCGNTLKQLMYPNFIFIDQEYSVYVADRDNNRVMKWIRGAQEGTVVAGGHGQGSSDNQLPHPHAVIVDQFGNVYVADHKNHRIMRWLVDANEGSVIVGGNGLGTKADQLYDPTGLSFDREGNLYVVDYHNHRVQKFDLIID